MKHSKLQFRHSMGDRILHTLYKNMSVTPVLGHSVQDKSVIMGTEVYIRTQNMHIAFRCCMNSMTITYVLSETTA